MPTFNIFSSTNEANLTFSAKDLFLERDDKIYFFISYDWHKDDQWVFGSILLEKYITVFNNDLKKLNILKKKNNSDDNNNKGTLILIIVLIVIFTALIFTFIGLVFGKKINTRKKKANELEDDYDYSPQNDNKIIDSNIN